MTAFCDHCSAPARAAHPLSIVDPLAAKTALERLVALCRDLERDAAYADTPQQCPVFPVLHCPEDFPPPNAMDLDDLLEEEPLFVQARARRSLQRD